jgi:peptidoglycan/xylan/chitin deacetylase (PgdA/CDA1 family)
MTPLTLSFDNGPDPEATPRVLDLLRAHDARAHFFVLGKQVATAEGRRLLARIHDEGHLIGNHSFSHQIPLGEDPRPDAVAAEIEATEAVLAELRVEPAPGAARRFRPFGGGGVLGPHLLSQRAVEHLVAQRYTCVLWNAVPRDWEDEQGWPARALEQCRQQRHPVLVLHDTPRACAARLDEFLTAARAEGFQPTLELPVECTPILAGELVGSLDRLVAAGAGAARRPGRPGRAPTNDPANEPPGTGEADAAELPREDLTPP